MVETNAKNNSMSAKSQIDYDYNMVTVNLYEWKGRPSSYCMVIRTTGNWSVDAEEVIKRLRNSGKCKRRRIKSIEFPLKVKL